MSVIERALVETSKSSISFRHRHGTFSEMVSFVKNEKSRFFQLNPFTNIIEERRVTHITSSEPQVTKGPPFTGNVLHEKASAVSEHILLEKGSENHHRLGVSRLRLEDGSARLMKCARVDEDPPHTTKRALSSLCGNRLAVSNQKMGLVPGCFVSH